MQHVKAGRGGKQAAIAVCLMVLCAAPLLLAQVAKGPGGTLERVRERGSLRLGYRVDARPFSYKDNAGAPDGYSVALCRQIVAALKAEPGMAGITDEWVPVTAQTRFSALQQGQIDLLCGAESMTLERRTQMSFSIPIFPGGIGLLVRSDAPTRLKDVLVGRAHEIHPTWRASVTRFLQTRAFAAIEGTTSEKWLTDRLRDLQVTAPVSMVSSYDAGVEAVLERKADALFGERAVLLDAAKRNGNGRLVVLDRLFTWEPLAFALPRGDEDFRLLVDRALSGYDAVERHLLYVKWFGEPDTTTLTFFRWTSLPK